MSSTRTEGMMLCVLIPAYNEASSIGTVLRRVLELSQLPLKVIVIDDGATDATGKIAESVAAHYPARMRIRHHEKNLGYFRTLLQEIDQIPAPDAFVVISADDCDDVSLLPQMFAALERGADIVCASRYMRGGLRRGGGKIKGTASRCLNFLLQKITTCPTGDLSNSYKIIRKRAIETLHFQSKAYELFVEIILKAQAQGCTIVEMPTSWQERRTGASTFRLWTHGQYYLRWLLFAFLLFLRRHLKIKKGSHNDVSATS